MGHIKNTTEILWNCIKAIGHSGVYVIMNNGIAMRAYVQVDWWKSYNLPSRDYLLSFFSSSPAWSSCLPVRLLLVSGDIFTKTRWGGNIWRDIHNANYKCVFHYGHLPFRRWFHPKLYSLPANAKNFHDFLHRFQISKDVIGFYDTVYDRGTQETLADKKEAAAAVLKVFHETVSSLNLKHIFYAPH